jgi:hypothetical protein
VVTRDLGDAPPGQERTAARWPRWLSRAEPHASSADCPGLMGLQQFERRLERMVEGVFARAFRGNLQPVEIGRRLTREMDLRRTMAPRGTITPNQFTVVLSPSDRDRFAPIEGELVTELEDVAREHASAERYVLLGPISITMETDDDLAAGMVLISGQMARSADAAQAPAPAPAPAPVPDPAPVAAPGPAPAFAPGPPPAPAFAPGPPPAPAPGRGAAPPVDSGDASLVLPNGRRLLLGAKPLVVGRLPDSGLVVTDPNVSRYHAEVRLALAATTDLRAPEYEVCDMGSTNGTKVNGVQISGAQVLHDGDTISVGATTIRFERS